MSAQIAIIGAGWAGLASAVQATLEGHHVTLFEMAPHLGGRARQVDDHASGLSLDNGQHLLIGAYRQTLQFMRLVGVDLDTAFLRQPLKIVYPNGAGLMLRPGHPVPSFLKAVMRYNGWRLADKLALLKTTTTWGLQGFACTPDRSVEQLLAHLPTKVRTELLDPLCVAALNTPASKASARVFLRILKDALFSGQGSSDLLIPRRPLSQLWPDPANAWLTHAGASIVRTHRVQNISAHSRGWSIDGQPFDAAIVACSATQAAHLVQPIAPGWAHTAQGLRYEPIITVYAHSPGTQLPHPMLTLASHAHAPAQYVFDLHAIHGTHELLAFVISGAQAWVDKGQEATVQAVLSQGQTALAPYLRGPLTLARVITEKRATFLCTPQLERPPSVIAPGLHAGGDYIVGPYPATLEGAMRLGVAAVSGLLARA